MAKAPDTGPKPPGGSGKPGPTKPGGGPAAPMQPSKTGPLGDKNKKK